MLAGKTLKKVMPLLEAQQPRSLRVASLLEKRVKGTTRPGFDAEFVGFSIPDEFVVVSHQLMDLSQPQS